jgi:recombination protein RecT
VNGRLEILGIVGYQGIIELMYRAGAVSSVVADVVYERDEFSYQPGRDEVPQHVIDWDAEDRGQLRLVYAYARMQDGAVSKVVVLSKAAIDTIKKSSQGSDSKYSPWVNHPASMWLKSAVRQLAKWVPTSAEYVLHAERIRAERGAASVDTPTAPALPSGGIVEHLSDEQVNRTTGEIIDSDRDLDGVVVDAEILDPDGPEWPDVAQPGGGA